MHKGIVVVVVVCRGCISGSKVRSVCKDGGWGSQQKPLCTSTHCQEQEMDFWQQDA